jgi:hypothetical protein
MIKQDLDALAQGFIDHVSQPHVWDKDMVLRERDNSNTKWAMDKVLDITYERPHELWDLILEVLRRNPDDYVMSVLAAGPLEDYLVKGGEDAITRVEAQAASDSHFKHLLGGVWRNDMSESTWARVLACRGEPW